jgi:hypothetical protein
MNMSLDTTPSHDTLAQLSKGDKRLKRVEVSITTRTRPETKLRGYALVSELNDSMLTFFSTQKFKIDEILIAKMVVDSQELEFQLRMSHMNEQISSGRIMTAIPDEDHPFPALKFYRCFAKIIELKRLGQSTDEVPIEPELKVA